MMFEGYYGRRRLKTLIAILIGALVLIALIHRRKDPLEETAYFPLPENPTNIVVEPRASDGFLSTISFTNSPYLDLSTVNNTKTIPLFVLSRAVNIEVRDAIRRTWGFNRPYLNGGLRLRVLFIVGTDDFMTQRIRMEQNVFDDVIQVSIPDMYSFVAYKELSIMKWVRMYLPQKQFYLKTEEHVVINMDVLVEKFIPIVQSVAKERLVIGWFGAEHVIQRGSYQKFIEALIPANNSDVHYAMSLLYAVTSSAAHQMLEALYDVELIEYPGDPFVTGILRDAAQIQISNIAKMTTDMTYELINGPCKLAFKKNARLLICTTSLNVGSTQSMIEYFDAWNVLIKQQ